jgi:hypothetical protein
VNSVVQPCLAQVDWRALYRAAVLETQGAAIPQRVSEAETAVLTRGQEISYDGSAEEKEELEDALYILRAFRRALEHSGSEYSLSQWESVTRSGMQIIHI